MANCLIEKLKGAVNYDNPDYYGQLAVNVVYNASADDTSKTLELICSAGTKVKLIGNATFTAQIDGHRYGNLTDYTIPTTSSCYISLPNANAQFVILDKYALKKFANDLGSSHRVSLYSVDMSKFEYCTDMTNIRLRYSSSGSISSISKLTQLTYVDVSFTEVSGTYDEIAHIIGLTNASFQECNNMSGTVEGFANKQIENGRTSGKCLLYGPNLTYGGTTVPYKWIKYGSSMVNPTEAETAQGWQASDTQ